MRRKSREPAKRTEDKCRHIRDNREGRDSLSLCGCLMQEEWGRPPLQPKGNERLEYLINKLRGCKKCLHIWMIRFGIIFK